MNCKQGDLAVVVRSKSGNEGKVVTCVRFVGAYRFSDGSIADSWLVDPALPKQGGKLGRIFCDDQLRPIRDNPGEDETLTWAGKPEQVTA